MKFREFVGEKKANEVRRRIVNTNLGKTESGFLRKVQRQNPDGSRIDKNQLYETYLGFALSKRNLKRVFDYIKSWLIRYDVPFKSTNPYLTTHLLTNLPSPTIFIQAIKGSKKSMSYKPKGTLTVISNDEKNFPRTIQIEPDDKDYLVLNYYQNKDHFKILERIFDGMDVEIINRFCHVKLFEVESGILNHRMYEDMMYSVPEIPEIRLGNIGLIRRK